MLGPVVVVNAEGVGNDALGFFFFSLHIFWTKKAKNWRCSNSIPGRKIAIAAAAAAAGLLRPPPAAMRWRGGRHILKKVCVLGHSSKSICLAKNKTIKYPKLLRHY